jgi:hypothetical protein
MNEELDGVIRPHAPSPLPGRPDKDGHEIDPVGVDSIVNVQIWFDPIAVHISGIGFLRAEAAIDVDLFDARIPKRFNCDPQPLSRAIDDEA